jgi:hypothetical protein
LLKETLFTLLVIVAAALVFDPRPIAMFLSPSIGCHYKPYYEIHEFLLSYVLFYYAVFLVVSSMVMLLIVLMVMIQSYLIR